MLAALKAAAQRGVSVKIIIPRYNDSLLVKYASRARYQELADSGVQIFLFHGGLLHSKTITVDRDFSLFGSVNLDMRSFWLNFEATLIIYCKHLPRNCLPFNRNTFPSPSNLILISSRNEVLGKCLKRTQYYSSPHSSDEDTMTMRILLISDIHGNYPALQAIDRQLDAASFDYIMNSGDSLVYAPFPNETLDWLSGHRSTPILGNTDQKVIRLIKGKSFKKPRNPEKRIMYTSTAEALRKTGRRYLLSLSERAGLELFPSGNAMIKTKKGWGFIMAALPTITNCFSPILRMPDSTNWPV